MSMGKQFQSYQALLVKLVNEYFQLSRQPFPANPEENKAYFKDLKEKHNAILKIVNEMLNKDKKDKKVIAFTTQIRNEMTTLSQEIHEKQNLAELLARRPPPKVLRIDILDKFAIFEAIEFNPINKIKRELTLILEAEKRDYIKRQRNQRDQLPKALQDLSTEAFTAKFSADFDESLRKGGYDLDELFKKHGNDPAALFDAITKARDASDVLMNDGKASAYMNDGSLKGLFASAQDVNGQLMEALTKKVKELQQLRGTNGDPALQLLLYLKAKEDHAADSQFPLFDKWNKPYKAWSKFTGEMLVQGKLNKSELKKYNTLFWEGEKANDPVDPEKLASIIEKMSDAGFDSPEKYLVKKELTYQQVEKIATGTQAQTRIREYLDQNKNLINLIQILEYAKTKPNFNIDAKIMTNKKGEKCSMIDFAIEYGMVDFVQILKTVGAKPTLEIIPIVDKEPHLGALRQVALADYAKVQTKMQEELKKPVHAVMKAHTQEPVKHEPPSKLPPTESVKGIRRMPGAIKKTAVNKVSFDLPEDKPQVRVTLPKEGRVPPPKKESVSLPKEVPVSPPPKEISAPKPDVRPKVVGQAHQEKNSPESLSFAEKRKMFEQKARENPQPGFKKK